MTRRYGTYYPRGVSVHVPLMSCSGGMGASDIVSDDLGAPETSDNDCMLVAQSMTTAGTTLAASFAATYTATEAQMGKWGRAIRCVASGASTGTVTLRGRDYLGQLMTEEVTLAGTTPVIGGKCFRYLDSVTWTATSAVDLTIGTSNSFGLRYRAMQMVSEIKNGAAAANAGAIIAGLVTSIASTAVNADVRARYTPSTVLANGTNTFEVRYVADIENLHGNAQYYA